MAMRNAQRLKRALGWMACFVVYLVVAPSSSASSSGIHSASFSPTFSSGCNNCHSGGSTPTAEFFGITSGQMLDPGQLVTSGYVRITSPQSHAGFNTHVTGGTLSVGGTYSANTKTISSGGVVDMTHSAKLAASGGYVRFGWYYTAPSTPGTYTIRAWGNSVNNNASTTGDRGDSIAYTIYVCKDSDNDGYHSTNSPSACGNNTDCNDSNNTIYPGAAERCNNISDDCDGSIDEGCDDDGDNYCQSGLIIVGTPSTCTAGGGDCNDGNNLVNPGRTEICNNIDDDCNGSPAIDEGCDDDTDNYCDSNMTVVGTPSTCTAGGGDCNDNNSAISPGDVETCSNTGVDNDCDTDATELTNGVHNGDSCATGNPGICSAGTRYCNGTVLACQQTNSAGTETCSNLGVDNDCDNDATELTNGVHSGDSCSTGNPGICSPGTRDCSGGALICDQTASAGTETCANTGVDNDCDGDAAELTNGVHSGDACTTGNPGVCSPGTRACTSGNLVCTQTTASSAEKCDNLDNNCNSSTDEGCDDDGDEYCDINMTTVGMPGVCPNGGADCDDTLAVSHPNGTEICDGKDNNCNSQIDENIGAITCGIGECTRTATGCVNGVPQNCTPGAPSAEICDGKDNDCNGVNDNGLGSTTCGQGICARTQQNCVGGMSQTCMPGPAGSESCANQATDDDCDGDASELTNGVHAGDACSTGVPGICAAGTRACNGTALACAQTTSAGNETCLNLGTDNDCDGDASELTNGVHQGDACSTGNPGVCAGGTASCSSGAFVCAQTTQPSSEICDGNDNDCNGQADDGLPTISCGVGECKKTVAGCVNGSANTCTPGASTAESCDDKDNDCDGVVDNGCDDDNDDYCDANLTTSGTPGVCPNGGGDCDDTTAVTSPGAPEICDGKDNDCNTQIDDDIQATTCGVGECTNTATGCVNGVPQNCTPGQPAAEVCDGLDNDCNGVIDNGLAVATCGMGECAAVGSTCDSGSCNAGSPATEVCDGLDNDCDGTVDNGIPLATCGQGDCMAQGTTCDPSSCTPIAAALPEVCDGKDNDCNGLPDDGLALASCGAGACAAQGTSCLPSSCTPGTPEQEKCDDIDNDCDGVVDNGCDDDGDGYCDLFIDYVGSAKCPNGPGDCDDYSADNYPGAPELCDALDNNCDGTADEGTPEPSCGKGECKALGTACVNGVAENCTPGQPSTEGCDGLDNDCDGVIDNGIAPVSCGTGECEVQVAGCDNGSVPTCTPLAPGTEICDGLDNDCDGTPDNGELCTSGEQCVNGACTNVVDADAGADAGAGGSGNDAGTDGGAPAPAPGAEDDGGCGCSIPAQRGSGPATLTLLLLGLAIYLRRRRAA